MKRAMTDLAAEFQTTVAELTAARAVPVDPTGLPPKTKKTPKATSPAAPNTVPVKVWNRIDNAVRKVMS